MPCSFVCELIIYDVTFVLFLLLGYIINGLLLVLLLFKWACRCQGKLTCQARPQAFEGAHI